MKQLIIIIMMVISTIFIVGCTTSYQPSESTSQNVDLTEDILENDPLISNLKTFNDSLYSECSQDTKGLRDFFYFMKHVAIVAADVKGAMDGAKWGGKILGGFGAAIGAIIVGTTCSVIQGLCCDSRAETPMALNQNRVELAYVNAKLNDNLVASEKISCNNIKIDIPEKYKTSLDVGIYHNVTLRALTEDIPIQYSVEDGLSREELEMLHSDDFTSKYNLAINNPNTFSFEYLQQNITKEDRVVQLFLEAYDAYPADMDDVNFLINSYIRLIEQDNQLTETQKAAVYAALSTAAYSTSYWSSELSD